MACIMILLFMIVWYQIIDKIQCWQNMDVIRVYYRFIKSCQNIIKVWCKVFLLDSLIMSTDDQFLGVKGFYLTVGDLLMAAENWLCLYKYNTTDILTHVL